MQDYDRYYAVQLTGEPGGGKNSPCTRLGQAVRVPGG